MLPWRIRVLAGFVAFNLLASAAAAGVYRVKSGDTLGSISRRYSTTVENLKSLNNLSGNTIHVGQRLKVPGEVSQPESSSSTYYTVKSGDTLAGISRRVGVSLANLKNWNNLKSSRIYAGQKLRLKPVAGGGGSAPRGYATRKYYYTVRKGDSLSIIARRTHTTVARLRSLNRLKKNSVIRPGQRLVVSVRYLRPEARGGTGPDTPPEIDPKPIIEGELVFHTVKEGETVESIAQQYGLSADDIRSANLMPGEAPVRKGQILAIPSAQQP
ncbi:MAG TPA: LysM peptidoglycan-binding domain-containing protein [bacterium]|nr:LysM peptidoglycan-binding domain-containing protein [bacterium]HNS47902.1 LysM peptidoglycan-binding domain-containing protein [bacterium]